MLLLLLVVVVLVVVARGERRSVPSLRERPLRVLLLGAAGDRGGRRVAVWAVVILVMLVLVLALVLVLCGVERVSDLYLVLGLSSSATAGVWSYSSSWRP